MLTSKVPRLRACSNVAVYLMFLAANPVTAIADPDVDSPSNHDARVAGQSIGRQVRVVSISFYNKPVEEIERLVDAEGARGADVIALPETWTGKAPIALDSPLMKRFSALAKKHRTYIVNPVYRQEGEKSFNSAVLIDRDGEIAGVYDKAYPYWAEFDDVDNLAVGTDAPVFETDFGKLGIAICFDVNFPEIWSRLADRGAELVIWPSAYCAGSALQAHAINHHFYIVTSTWKAHCLAFDITGERLLEDKQDDVNVTRITLDLDRRVYHENFNWAKAQKLLEQHADDVALDKVLDLEQWFVLKAKRPGVDILALAAEYDLEEHRDYIVRSRSEMDRRRSGSLLDLTSNSVVPKRGQAAASELGSR